MNNKNRDETLIVHRAPIEKLIKYYDSNPPGTLPLPVADAIDSLKWSYSKFDPYAVPTPTYGHARRKAIAKRKKGRI